ncbi:hypothetical protein G7085_08385 [Tessaracoccus sp. HDW20]|uniref:hypothetical protein n=1 Tax=Tessaracoccus coleopterorum TaxID=2714950 RepID=UPI0018D3EB57|nr:hypothetical protein [Tessaracoccus coleopterorum]NHB84620.1 hypothetical protein [Tessaracoccus coleopterorum]
MEDNVMQVIYATDPDTTCSVLAPGENAPDLALDSSMSFTRDDIAYSAIGRIGGPDQDNGTYTVECDGAGVVVGPPLSMGAITLGVVFAVAGFGLLIVALFLLIAGFVLRASARRSG